MTLLSRDLPTQRSLFPYSEGLSHWTTFQGVNNALPLTENSLKPQKLMRELPIVIDRAPDRKEGLKIHYPKGSYKLSAEPKGGISYYSKGPGHPFTLDYTREATFGYSVYFPSDFEFVMGGKLPGLYGGDSGETAVSCSGGRQDTSCFSTRLMWRENGAGEVYAYFPPANFTGFEPNAALCDGKNNICDPPYGVSLGRGNFTFPRGEWTTVSQRVRLNDIGMPNGEVELLVNGVKVIEQTGIILRGKDSSRIRGTQVQSFFGGGTSDWATPKNQDIFISDFSVAIIDEYPGAPSIQASGDANRMSLDHKSFSIMLIFSVFLSLFSPL